MAVDYCEVESGREELERSPWLIPASLKFPCDVDRDIRQWCLAAPRPSRYGVFYKLALDLPDMEVAVLSPVSDQAFKRLVTQWKEETWFMSSVKKRIAHPAYLQIIGHGRAATRWILEELKREPDYWYAALEAITRTDPAPHAENMNQLREAWLAWGKANGHID